MTDKPPPIKVSEQWVCKDLIQLKNFCDHIIKIWDCKKSIKIECKTLQNTRTTSQNALLHVWIDEITRFFNDHRPEGCLHSYDPEWTKNRLKQMFGEKVIFRDPITKTDKTYLLSTAKYGMGVMYHFMTAIQIYALENLDLILESQGEFKEIQGNNGQIPQDV